MPRDRNTPAKKFYIGPKTGLKYTGTDGSANHSFMGGTTPKGRRYPSGRSFDAVTEETRVKRVADWDEYYAENPGALKACLAENPDIVVNGADAASGPAPGMPAHGTAPIATPASSDQDLRDLITQTSRIAISQQKQIEGQQQQFAQQHEHNVMMDTRMSKQEEHSLKIADTLKNINDFVRTQTETNHATAQELLELSDRQNRLDASNESITAKVTILGKEMKLTVDTVNNLLEEVRSLSRSGAAPKTPMRAPHNVVPPSSAKASLPHPSTPPPRGESLVLAFETPSADDTKPPAFRTPCLTGAVLFGEQSPLHQYEFNEPLRIVASSLPHDSNLYVVPLSCDPMDPTKYDVTSTESHDYFVPTLAAIVCKNLPFDNIVFDMLGNEGRQVYFKTMAEVGLEWVEHPLAQGGRSIFVLESQPDRRICEDQIKMIRVPIERPEVLLNKKPEKSETFTIHFQPPRGDPEKLVIERGDIENSIACYIEDEESAVTENDKKEIKLLAHQIAFVDDPIRNAKVLQAQLIKFQAMVQSLKETTGLDGDTIINNLDSMKIHKLYPSNFDYSKGLCKNKTLGGFSTNADTFY